MHELQVIWYILIFFFLTGYLVLDGFDLGVGCWHIFTRKLEHRQLHLNAISPFWDGNEVWLVTAGAAIFVAFPPVYATIFSGLYLALMLLLFSLILRAVSIEFAANSSTQRERAVWDISFAIGSSLAIVVLGVAVGNILLGLPLDQTGNFHGTFLSLLNPYSLLVGVTNLALVAMHGALYLSMKTTAEDYQHTVHQARISWFAALPLILLTLLITASAQPQLLRNYHQQPLCWLIPILSIIALLLAGYWNKYQQSQKAFIASMATIVLIIASAALALYPTLVPAIPHPEWSLTIADSSSWQTLRAMLIIATIGMPLVLGYTIFSYRLLGGVTKAESHY